MATKTQARLLTWSVILLNSLFILLAIVLLSTQGSMFNTLGDVSARCMCVPRSGAGASTLAQCAWRAPLAEHRSSRHLTATPLCHPPLPRALQFRSFYKAQLILGSICLGVEFLILLWLGTSVRGASKEGRAW